MREMAGAVAPAIQIAGMQLLTGLSVIMVVWTGTQMALSGGGFNMAAFVRLVITLAIPLGILEFYVDSLPGTGGMSVPDVITGMGGWLQGVILADTTDDVFTSLSNMGEQIWSNASTFAGESDASWWERVTAFVANAVSLTLGLGIQVSLFALFLVVFAVGQAQVIWANLAMSLAILLGPIFIPFFVVPQLSFLFWGWFKTMLTYSLYAAVAAAVFRITVAVGLQVLDALRLPESYASVDGVAGLFGTLMLGIFFCVAALLASLKVGEFCQMLVSGGGAAGSGAGTRAMQTARVAAGGF